MYQRGKAVMPDGSENVPSPFGFADTQPPDPGMVNVANPDGHNFTPHWDERPYTLAWVHGWRMEYGEAMNYSDTLFKRLWHRGFKGRFATFRWPTFTGLPPLAKYNESEYRAWKSGNALRQYVSDLPYPNAKNICAHSMGNIVVGSAIRQGMNANNYILMQAAVPSCAYNPNQANYPDFVDHALIDPSPDAASDLGYRDYLGGLPGNLVNFFNFRDDALSAWDLNNTAFKPNRAITVGQMYRYDPALAEGQRCVLTSEFVERLVSYPHESMAFVASSRTLVVGREPTGGCVDVNHDLDENYGFAENHSAQWEWPIQRLKPFFDQVLTRYQITPNP